MRFREWLKEHRGLVGYAILATGWVMTLYLQSQDVARDRVFVEQLKEETEARQAFDDRRQYELCLAGNERIEDINERFRKLDMTLASFGDPNDPKVKRFLAEEKAAELKPRKCVIHPQNSAGPQR